MRETNSKSLPIKGKISEEKCDFRYANLYMGMVSSIIIIAVPTAFFIWYDLNWYKFNAPNIFINDYPQSDHPN